MALALEAAALAQTAPGFVLEAFCKARLDPGARALAYGASAAEFDARAIIERAMPV